MPSRKLTDLTPVMRPLVRAFIADCAAQGVEVLVTCTWRSQTEQTALYAQGRTAPGKIVTWTRKSRHTETLPDGTPDASAVDVVPLRNGKAVWSATDSAWAVIGRCARSRGLEWGGDWQGKRDLPHIQLKRS